MSTMKFELNRLIDYSDPEILEEIRRVAASCGTTRLKREDFNKLSRVSSDTIKRRFGGWKEGLEAAGLGHLYGGPAVTAKMKAQKGRELTDPELLQELVRISLIVGRKDLVVDDINSHSLVGENIFAARFGTFSAALLKAGLEVRPKSRRYTDEECYENLYAVWEHYGRKPTFREMNSLPSVVGSEAYKVRFERWSLAIQSFLERVNQDSDRIDISNSEAVITELPTDLSLEKLPAEPRKVPLGLRFKVLVRDRYRCVLCGDNPPKNPDCSLHVDHILPWSKGGKTEIENLRTLCQPCNIGRGNRFSD
jgi:hypothetical protein